MLAKVQTCDLQKPTRTMPTATQTRMLTVINVTMMAKAGKGSLFRYGTRA